MAPVLLLCGCAGVFNRGVLDPAGPVAAQQRVMFGNVAVIMAVIIVPIMIAVPLFAWWWRAGNARASHKPDWAFSGRIELVIWAVPTLTIILLGGIAWIGSHDLDPARPLPGGKPLEVEVVSLDWKWLFIYPEQGIATVNRLVTPVNRPVHYRLTSASVMTVFWVPRLGTMIYTMNGMESDLNLAADRVGVFAGRAAHVSGDGFSDMVFTVEAVPPADFDRFVAATRAAGGALDRAAYDRLAEQSVLPRPVGYGAVQPGLFEAVVTQMIPPAGGPDNPHGGRPMPLKHG